MRDATRTNLVLFTAAQAAQKNLHAVLDIGNCSLPRRQLRNWGQSPPW